MFKKAVALLLALLLLLMCSCNKEKKVEIDAEAYATLSKIIADTNAEKRYNAGFLLDISHNTPSESLMFVQGNLSIDKNEPVEMSGAMAQVVLGESSNQTFSYKDGIYYEIDGEEKNSREMPVEELLNAFLCGEAMSFDVSAVTSLVTADNSTGKLYKFTVDKGEKSKFDNLLGDGLYDFTSLKAPQKNLTEYSDISCDYSVTDINGKAMLKSISINFTVTMYDTPPYYPSKSLDVNDYKVVLDVLLKRSYSAFGNDVIIEPIEE